MIKKSDKLQAKYDMIIDKTWNFTIEVQNRMDKIMIEIEELRKQGL